MPTEPRLFERTGGRVEGDLRFLLKDRAVESALNRCLRMLVILSPASVDSDNVLNEISFALRKQKTVIPVLYLDCDIPIRLERHHQVDFRSDYARGLKLLIKVLGIDQPLQSASTSLSPLAQQGVLKAFGLNQPGQPAPPAPDSGVRKLVAEQVELELQRRQAAERVRLEEERQAAEKARLEEEQKEAVERARLEEERKQAAERALEEERKQAEAKERLEQERKQADEQAWLEERRKQDAEHARLAEERKQANAEKARLEQAERPRLEAERSGAVTPPQLAVVPQAFKKIAAIVGGIVLLGLLLYWATRPKPQESATQAPPASTATSTPPPTSQSPPSNADAEKAAAEKAAADQAAARKPAADKAAAEKKAADQAAQRKPTADESAAEKAAAAKPQPPEAMTAEAMFNKGYAYQYGQGVSKDYAQAVSWYRKAAEAGNAGGMNNLGYMYFNGLGV
jgi:TPR repeat protein